MVFRHFSCVGLVAGRRELRHGARLVPLCGIPEYLDELVSKSKTLHRSQAVFSLPSGTATDVFRHAPESLAEREFRSECISMPAGELCSAVRSRCLEF